MNKPEIVALISQRAEITKKAAASFLDALVQTVHDSLKTPGGRLRIAELGTFRIVEIGQRRGVNPRTGKRMKIPAMRLPRFTPAKSLRLAAGARK
jgi:DNA-binding protein HU-beta